MFHSHHIRTVPQLHPPQLSQQGGLAPAQALEELGSPRKVIGSSAAGAAGVIRDVSYPGADQWASGMGHTVGPGRAVQSESGQSQGRIAETPPPATLHSPHRGSHKPGS